MDNEDLYWDDINDYEQIPCWDENGELPVQTINGKQVKPTVEQMLKTYSIEATNELYPQGSYSERQRIQYQNDMYNAMLALYNRYLNYQNN